MCRIARSDYGKAIQEVVANYPGVTVTFEQGRKHMFAVLQFDGKKSRSSFPSTPSDSRRGTLNKAQDIRRALREMGATMQKEVANDK